jgi:translation initiation factor IF-2
MSKVRVYELAKEMGLTNKELITKLQGLGVDVRNHMSALETGDVDRVKRTATKEASGSLVEERIRPTVVRRKRKGQEDDLGGARDEAAGIAPEPAEARPEPVEAPASDPRAPTRVEEPPLARTEPEPVRAVPEPVRAEPEPASVMHGEDLARPQRIVGVAAEIHGPRPLRQDIPRASERMDRPSSTPPPASDRFAHAPLPPGVIQRGNTVGFGGRQLSEEDRKRIVAEHNKAKQRPEPGRPRREVRGHASIGPAGRPQSRMSKRRMPAGKKGLKTEITVPSEKKRKIRIEDQIQLQQLAQRMGIKSADLLMKLIQLGMSGVHINSTLDADTAGVLAGEFGYEVENVARSEEEVVGDARGEFLDAESDRELRPPIVTVMGHVDHGKTSLLDRIRRSSVAEGEAGGITQHIGAYRVDTDRGTVVFLDTPGHEAFTSMRARGAQATDVVVLVCAADDGVMPQTKEAISHAKDAGVPIIVALNKCDKPGVQLDRVMSELASEGLQPEEWGGDTMMIPTSAHTGQGIDELLDGILLQSEILELYANETIPAEGVVLEAYLDRGRGPVANVLVRNGSLHTGDYVVAGAAWGRVRALTDDRGQNLKMAGPATPVEILGLQDLPDAGDLLYKVTNQRKAQEVAESRRAVAGPISLTAARGLDQLQALMQSGDIKELKLVVKADVQGSIEALRKSFSELSTDLVKVNVIHTGVGGITEGDVMLASASSAIVIGFNVRPQGKATSAAKGEAVEIRTYNIIYEAIDDVKAAMAGLLAPKVVEEELGKAEVRQTFTIPKAGTIAGCMVTEGKIVRAAQARLVRDGIVVWTGQLSSLRRFKEDAREVTHGFECGIGLHNFNDVKEGDIIECFAQKEVAATL